MYCSKCGSAVSPSLTYCNRCGAKLSEAKEVKPEILLFFITAVFVFGIAAIMGLMVAMKFVFGPSPLVIAFTLLSFLIMIAVEGVFISILLGHKKQRKAKELGEEEARILPKPEFSVTEHTTRTLETVDRDGQTQ